MKKIVSTLFTIIFLSLSSFGIEFQATFNIKQFYSPEKGPYIETYINVPGAALTYGISTAGLPQAKLETTVIIKKKIDFSILDFRKKEILGQELFDSVAVDVIDQERFSLSPGKYIVEWTVKDLNSVIERTISAKQEIEIVFDSESISLSGTELLLSFSKAVTTGPLTKSGYDLIPMVHNYLNEDFEKIAYYSEIYFSNNYFNQDLFLTKVYIEKDEFSRPLIDYVKISKQQPKAVIPVLGYFDVKNLPSGRYNLVIEIRNQENQLVKNSKTFFYRSNSLVTEDTEMNFELINPVNHFAKDFSEDQMIEYFSSMRPICTEQEKRIMDSKFLNEKEKIDLNLASKFFYSFWEQRNPENPEEEFSKYKEKVKEVNKAYSTAFQKGYETDRGRIQLKYGKPNSILDRPHEPSALPYQIWQYYKIGDFTNRRFIFYNPTLMSNGYELIHSDMRGEIRNPNWEYMINGRNSTTKDLDEEMPTDQYGGNAKDYYLNPR